MDIVKMEQEETIECCCCRVEVPLSFVGLSTKDGIDFCIHCTPETRDPRNENIHTVLDIMNRTFDKAAPLKKELDALIVKLSESLTKIRKEKR